MRFSLVVVLIAALFSLMPSVASACSCAPPPPPKKALEQAHAVFAGKVVKIKQMGQMNYVTFEVSQIWKGKMGKQVTVATHIHGATCGYSFSTKGDGTYIVYCYQPKNATVLHTNICTRTRPLSSAKEDLEALGKGEKPKQNAEE